MVAPQWALSLMSLKYRQKGRDLSEASCSGWTNALKSRMSRCALDLSRNDGIVRNDEGLSIKINYICRTFVRLRGWFNEILVI